MSVNLSRRGFMGGAMALAGLGGCRALDGLFGSPELRFGLVSDIHVTTPKSATRFVKALRYFKSRGVDAVVVPGDLTDWGIRTSLRYVKEAWDSVFAGTDVVPLFCTGNHDYEGWWYQDMTMEMHANGYTEVGDAIVKMPGGMAAVWKEVFGEEFAPIRLRTVKGYDFVSVEYYGAGDKGRENPAAFLKEHAARLSGSGKPFFLFQHLPIHGTTPDATKWCDNFAYPVLKGFPNAVAITGHTHRPYCDDRQLWQGEFTVVGVPSLSYPSFPKAVSYENGEGLRNGKAEEAMLPLQARRDLEGTQGMLVSVYAGEMVVERLDFGKGGVCEGAPAWVVPFGGGEKPFALEELAKRVPVPRFPSEASLDIETRNTENRQGKWTIVMNCEFPSAVVPAGWRVFDYEIRAVPEDGSAPLVKNFFSPAYHLLPEKEPARQRFWFNVAALPQDKDYRLEVRAGNCFGKRSAPLVSRVMRGKPGLATCVK